MEVQLLKIKVAVVRPGAVNTGMLPESERKLDEFVSNTKYYSVNATRFRKIVGKVEAKHVPPEKVALVIRKALTARRPKLTYKVNRNPLLLLLNALPKRLQLFVIRKILE
jgi:short-subunit dehydrogenase